MAKFVYRGNERTGDQLKQRAKDSGGSYDSMWKPGMPLFKPKEGENVIRLMPSTWEEPDWDMPIFVHYDVGPDKARYLCNNKMNGETCPICDAKLQAADKDEAYQLSPKKGCIVWLIDRKDERAGPQLWAMPFTKVRNEIYGRAYDKRTNESLLIDNHEEGFDVEFARSGSGDRTQYTGVDIARSPSALHDDPRVAQKWIEYVQDNPLPSVLNFFDADYIGKVLFGKVSAKREEPVEEVAELPRSARRAAAVVEDEPEEPAPRSRRAAAPVEEPPFDADTGEVQDDPPPRRASRRALLDEPEEPEEAPPARRRNVEEEVEPVAAARRSLERLRPASGRR